MLALARWFLLAIAILIFNQSALAADWQIGGNGKTTYVHLERESGLWVLAAFEALDGEMQSRTLHRTFSSERLAKRAVKKLLRQLGYSERQADGPARAPTPVSESGPRSITEVPGSSIWKATESWSWGWENAFAKWVRDEVSNDFFQRYGIATDCADVAIGLRWIFARIHGLPAGNTMAGSGRLFTHDSMRKAWLGLERANEWHRDELFLAALDYMLDNAFTKTILWDGYPVAINKATFLPGLFHLEFHSQGGHTMILKELVAESGWFASASIKFVQSTLPREVRRLSNAEFIHASQPKREGGGFLRLRWPVARSDGSWTLLAENKHRDYSQEQYEPEFMNGAANFSSAVKTHLMDKVDVDEEFNAGLEQLWKLIEARVSVVENGFAQCKLMSCAKGTAGWDEYSTPTRDDKIREKIKFVAGVVGAQSDSDSSIHEKWREFIENQIEIGDRQIDIAAILENFRLGLTSSDPRDSIEKRWGLRP